MTKSYWSYLYLEPRRLRGRNHPAIRAYARSSFYPEADVAGDHGSGTLYLDYLVVPRHVLPVTDYDRAHEQTAIGSVANLLVGAFTELPGPPARKVAVVNAVPPIREFLFAHQGTALVCYEQLGLVLLRRTD